MTPSSHVEISGTRKIPGKTQLPGSSSPRATTRAAWARELERIWTDVASGDNVTAVVLPGRETIFFDSRGVLGNVRDPAFGPAFLRVWLDSRTAIQDLRAQLLGAAGATR